MNERFGCTAEVQQQTLPDWPGLIEKIGADIRQSPLIARFDRHAALLDSDCLSTRLEQVVDTFTDAVFQQAPVDGIDFLPGTLSAVTSSAPLPIAGQPVQSCDGLRVARLVR